MSLFDFERLVGFLTLATVGYTLAILLIPGVRTFLADRGAVFALLISGGATIGSLFLSEFLDQVPCELCWYQRIFMYPLPILAAVAIGRKSRDVGFAAIVLAGVGSLISIYHIAVQWIPGTGSCDLDNPCSSRILEFLGFISTPAMALAAFVGTAVSLYLWRSE